MAKVVNIFLAQAGGDISTVDLYHTSVTGSNLLQAGISASLFTEGSGINYTVDDNVDTFIAVVNDGGECQLTSGSFSSSYFQPYIRYFHIEAVGTSDATVELTYPESQGPTTDSIDIDVDFRDYSYVTIVADESAGYPAVSSFDGWYTEETGGTLHSTSNTLTITLDTFTASDNFYARFS